MQALTDAELAQAITSSVPGGPAEAELFRRFAPRIELYGRRHLGSRTAAMDLVQEVLLRVVEAVRASRLENAASLPSFVFGTCRNVCSDSRRADQKRERLAREATTHADDAIEPPVDARDVLRLFGCMHGLPEREAAVVRMSFWEDRAAEEIGTRLGVSAGNVRVIRHRALAKLVGCMHAEGAA